MIDAVGSEQPTFDELVALLKRVTKSRALVWHAPAGVALRLSGLIGALLRDVVLTDDEVHGLMSGVLESPGPAAGETRLSGWLEREADAVGRRYASEIARHYR